MNWVQRLYKAWRSSLGALSRRHDGSAAAVAVLVIVPLVLIVGMAVDLGRMFLAIDSLQGIADASALAGATVFTDSTTQTTAATTARNHFTQATATLPGNIQLTPVGVTATAATSCTGEQPNTVTVTASGTIGTTLLVGAGPSINFTVTATGAMPQVQMSIDVVKFDFDQSAQDINTFYWYKVPADGSLPTPSDLNFVIGNNAQTQPETVVTCVSPTQPIGFVLTDAPSALQPGAYTVNQYGGVAGQTYYYYSTLFPPSQQAYPGWAYDAALQIVMVDSNGNYPPPSAGIAANGSNYGYFDPAAEPLPAVAAKGSVTCADLNGNKIHLYWNDMGGIPDNYNYTDTEVTFGCQTSAAKSPYLLK